MSSCSVFFFFLLVYLEDGLETLNSRGPPAANKMEAVVETLKEEVKRRRTTHKVIITANITPTKERHHFLLLTSMLI